MISSAFSNRIVFIGVSFATIVSFFGIDLHALDHFDVRQGKATKRLSGHIVVEAQDGGILLKDRAGAIWELQPPEIVGRDEDATPFTTLPRDELKSQLLAELPKGFRTHDTAHYLIAYNTSQVYAEWCGGLYERLYGSFTNYWKNKGFPPKAPETPLVALVFADKASYSLYSRTELGDATSAIIGYYSMRTNRVTMYDLTGADELIGNNTRSSTTHINAILSRPEAERMVATIIHEATHQVAFNCGLQARYADIPLWVSEGIAVWFETPDLSSAKGWKNIGGVNLVRVADFRKYLPKRPADSLRTLISSDKRFRDPDTALDAYAEAWALNYFLFKKRGKGYVKYIKELGEKKPAVYDSPDERVAQFEACFGADWKQLDYEFLKYIRDGR